MPGPDGDRPTTRDDVLKTADDLRPLARPLFEYAAEKHAAMEIPLLRRVGRHVSSAFQNDTRDVLLELLYASSSDLLLLPIQDIFGWRDRINVPALISDRNWTWKLPWPVEDLVAEPSARERGAFTHALANRYERT